MTEQRYSQLKAAREKSEAQKEKDKIAEWSKEDLKKLSK
jgi:hypothetical protein